MGGEGGREGERERERERDFRYEMKGRKHRISRRKRNDSTCNQIHFEAVRYEATDWVSLAQEKTQWRAIVYTVMDIPVS